MSLETFEPCVIAEGVCDGLDVVHVDQKGVARINLYMDQLDADGKMQRILAFRLRMSSEVMREIADRMLTASIVAAQVETKAIEERCRNAH